MRKTGRSGARDWVVIPTKLSPPALPAGTIERPRLLARLGEPAGWRLALVSAPAGYGKTTLALQWLTGREGDVVWLSLDGADESPDRFLRYLVAGVRAKRPRKLARVASLLSAQTPPPLDYVAEVLLADLGELDVPTVLVLDDLQTIVRGESQDLVGRVVERLPESVRILGITRSDPAWPLGRWRGRGWLAEIRARDLRFTAEEAQLFLGEAAASGLSRDDLALLTERTEGWPAGLQLARITIARAADPGAVARRFGGSDRLVVDYLMDEVLSAQPPEILRLLAATAPLERFCAPLCDHLLSGSGAEGPGRELLAELARRGLFLVPLDSEDRWYRYHHLFAQLLLSHLPEVSRTERRREIERRAAEWFAAEGSAEEALNLWIRGGDLDAAAALFGAHLDEVLDESDALRILQRWLAVFPPGAEAGRPALLVARAHERYMLYDLGAVAAAVEEAEACLAGARERAKEEWQGLDVDLEALRSFLAYWQGDADAAVRHSERALARLEGGAKGWARSMATIYRIGGLYLGGRGEEAHRFIEEQILEECLRKGPHVGRIATARGYLCLYAYDLDGVERAARRLKELSATLPVFDHWLTEADYQLGVVALERDRLTAAAKHFRQVLDRRYLGLSRFVHDAWIGLALVAERRGEAESCAAEAAAARVWALEAGDPSSILVSDSFDSRGRAGADEGAASDWASAQVVDGPSLWLEVPAITRCERLLLDPDPQIRRSALAAIDATAPRFEARRNVRQLLRLSVLRADALAERGERAAALDELGRALDVAAPQGAVRPFLGGGGVRRELLEAVARRGRHRELIARVLSPPGEAPVALAGSQAKTDANRLEAGPSEPLTLRERQVLELLADRLSNKEIAARLSVSSEAVKKRLLNLYAKLGVHGRSDAVRAALACSLLERRTR